MRGGLDMKFSLGRFVMTNGIWDKAENDKKFTSELNETFRKYVNCDWGDTCKSDWKMNDDAVKNGNDRIFAVYKTSQGDIWIITEWDRSATTILFPDEY